MDLLTHVRDTVSTVKNALSDGKITADEAKAIVGELLELGCCLLGTKKSAA
ncbi:MAG: hypothetical protein LLG00_11625 [Planctomycetaceae bacterium]|nr:hypothetical protein [Planctomycetaceae bacterium]